MVEGRRVRLLAMRLRGQTRTTDLPLGGNIYALYVSGLRIPFGMTIDNVGQLVLLQGGRTRLRT